MTGKKLGFGLMRLPLLHAEDAGTVDLAAVRGLADQFLQAGFTYFDTAAPYHNGQSEIALRECVVKRYPRDSFTVTDKLSLFMLKEAGEIPGFFDGQLERCGVDYFDYYLLHAIGRDSAEQAERFGAFDFIAGKKAEGKIRHAGFSFHDKAEVLDEILTRHPEMEYVQLQLNYLDWEDGGVQSRRCCETCVKHGKPVIVMEPVKGGLLASLPEEAEKPLRDAEPGMSLASWAIRFAASQENVVMVLSGMSNEAQMRDNLSYMADFHPLTAEETALVERTAETIRSQVRIACTGCRYCVEGCPQKIAIPEYFKLMNKVSQFGPSQLPGAKKAYAEQAAKSGRASDCVKCGQCEEHCPQHLPVTKYLEDVTETLG